VVRKMRKIDWLDGESATPTIQA
ncbi:MAG: hypothetical protein RL081_1621, partial [Pseudomonadota bacterium]